MLYNIFSSKLSHLSSEQLAKYATRAAVWVAITLFVMKLIAWLTTGSDTLKLSCFDSGFDIVISSSNLLIITLISNRRNNNFLFGYDKAAALSALSQALLMCGIVTYTLFGTLSFETPNTNIYSMIILTFALLLSLVLIQFQQYVYKQTKSIIVKADMLHYQTDILVNSTAIICLIISWYYRFWWIDTMLAIIIGIYLIITISKLGLEALKVLLDHKKSTAEKHILTILSEYQIDNIHVTSSGMRDIIYMEIAFPSKTTLAQIENITQTIQEKLNLTQDNNLLNIKPKMKAES